MKKRVRICIHPAGTVLFAVGFLFADSRLALAALAALLVHEGAHLLAVHLCGICAYSVEITPFGGMMDIRQFESAERWKQIVIAAAGIAGSAVAAALCDLCGTNTLLKQYFYLANSSMAIVNALPLWPLDGARLIVLLAAYAGWQESLKRFFALLSFGCGLLLTLLGLYGVWMGIINPTLLAAGPYLWYAARMETIAARIRSVGSVSQKLQGGSIISAEVWAGNAEALPDGFISRIGRGGEQRYQLLAAVDPQSGKIQKWWTEQEILKQRLSTDRD